VRVLAFRRLTVRYDRHAASVLAFLHLACAPICLRPHLPAPPSACALICLRFLRRAVAG
jgi:hypothetical protein